MGNLRAVDLFASAGGLTLGMKRAGIETELAVEIDPYRALTFSGHSPTTEVVTRDIQSLAFGHLRGRIDLVYGGPPCQPFSSGGLRASHADERDMIPSFARALAEIQPSAFLMENVPGLTVGERRRYLNEVLTLFIDLGYQVAWGLLNAADFGVPQIRRRLIVVGMRSALFRFPRPTHGPHASRPHVAIRDVLPSHPIGRLNTAVVTYAKTPDLRPSPYDGQMFNGGGRPLQRAKPARTILASAGGNKTHWFDEMNLVPEYHRHLMTGGQPRCGELPGARRLTVTESAILQSFPAEMQFAGPTTVQYRQVGDAVPPLLGEVLARAIIQQFDGGSARSHLAQKGHFEDWQPAQLPIQYELQLTKPSPG